MNQRPPAILDHLASLADTTRSRLLLLLDRRELPVSQMCAVMQLPQSTVKVGTSRCDVRCDVPARVQRAER